METTKVFWTGRSQAVRLPQAFRVDAESMRIERRGQRIILDPVQSDWAWLDALNTAGERLDADAVGDATTALAPQSRDALETLFK
jgi:antitoxin VapB